MTPKERIRVLCAQLLRANNPEAIQLVSEELKVAIDAYATSFQGDFPVLDVPQIG